VVSRSNASMSGQFERDAQERPVPVTLREPEKFRAMQRLRFVAKKGKSIEVLAGSSDLAHARDLAGRLLAYDPSADTRAAVEKNLERAGQAESGGALLLKGGSSGEAPANGWPTRWQKSRRVRRGP